MQPTFWVRDKVAAEPLVGLTGFIIITCCQRSRDKSGITTEWLVWFIIITAIFVRRPWSWSLKLKASALQQWTYLGVIGVAGIFTHTTIIIFLLIFEFQFIPVCPVDSRVITLCWHDCLCPSLVKGWQFAIFKLFKSSYYGRPAIYFTAYSLQNASPQAP
jgi:hypothetical protein